jgi:multiple sugar transport system permease protein
MASTDRFSGYGESDKFVKMKYQGLLNNENFTGYVFIISWLIGFILFIVVPMGISFYISFTKYDMIGKPIWIGWTNFIYLFTKDPKFFTSIQVTFFYVAAAVPLRLITSLFIAFILNKKYYTGIYKTVYYLPSIVGSSAAVAIVFRTLFGTQGIINQLLNSFPLLKEFMAKNFEFFNDDRISFIGNIHTAIWVIILLYIWEFGSSMLIFLAGLQNIPEMYYEAAVVEGAGFWSKFFYITIPLLSPIMLFNLIMQTIQGFLVFTQVYIITEGGPVDRTLVYAIYMFRRAFEFHDMGEANAMAWMLLVAIGVVTAIIFGTSKYWVYYESKEG